ncbi:MAG: hypothetical protein GY797_36285 [Deltaproteobacteria bacterium]|nr:hypothetical protein [Deltaproteobacteria bacterium]
MALEKYLSETKIPVYRICMECTDSTSQGIILSCLLQQMNINHETEGVIVHDSIISKTGINTHDLCLFQANTPFYIKATQIYPNLWMYKIDISYLSSKFKRSQL